MKRRDFFKLSLATGSAALLPSFTSAANLNLGQINFSSDNYTNNSAQTIIVFMYGGASQLAGNMSNIDEIENKSENSYAYFRNIVKTTNNCWRDAGGTEMETLMSNGDMTLFRSCYSAVRESVGNKAHGECTVQNQKGSFDENAGGILANLAEILKHNGVIDDNTLMPFVSMEGESNFYTEGNTPLPGNLKPVGINEDFDNPYERDRIRQWHYYTGEEQDIPHYNENNASGFDPALTSAMDTLAQQNNQEGKIKDAFDKRDGLSNFINSIASSTTPDLGDDAYPNNSFSQKIEAAVKLLIENSDTKVVTVGTGGLGGWDDHNDARNYVDRSKNLFLALKSAMAHLKTKGKEGNINIMVFGEFGRNVNLNSTNGWDHGNLQNLYVLGGTNYFNHKGIVGETVVDNPSSINRLWLKPKSGTYWFEPLSIAATLYKIYGIENPEILTNNNGTISELFS